MNKRTIKLINWVRKQLKTDKRGCMCDDCRSARAVRDSLIRDRLYYKKVKG